MKIFIASSVGHVGKIKEDLLIQKKYFKLGIDTDINTLSEISLEAVEGDIVILKSIWGYHENYQVFLDNIDKLKKNKIILINDYKFIYWNVNKDKYLEDIADIGIIPTYPIGLIGKKEIDEVNLIISNKCATIDTDMFVIKPSISASGYLTYTFDRFSIEKASNLIISNPDINFILQPFIKEISEGELSIIILNGEIAYALNRFPGILNNKKEIKYIPREKLSSDIIHKVDELKVRIIKIHGDFPKICRLDLILSNNGIKIMEVELIDPDLFFREIPKENQDRALQHFADFL